MKKKLSLSVQLTERQHRMVEGTDFMEVTPAEVKSLLLRLKQLRKPEIVRLMRIKYDEFIHDKEKCVMARPGIDYAHHAIAADSGGGVHIDGYTELQWKLLNDETYLHPSYKSFICVLKQLREHGDNKAVEFLQRKYQSIIEDREKAILVKNNIPTDISYNQLTFFSIDNISLREWKTLSDPQYIPSKSYLMFLIHKFEKKADDKTATLLFNKYENILNIGESEPELTLEEADALFARLFNHFGKDEDV